MNTTLSKTPFCTQLSALSILHGKKKDIKRSGLINKVLTDRSISAEQKGYLLTLLNNC